jgi:hypothetical protein
VAGTTLAGSAQAVAQGLPTPPAAADPGRKSRPTAEPRPIGSNDRSKPAVAIEM